MKIRIIISALDGKQALQFFQTAATIVAGALEKGASVHINLGSPEFADAEVEVTP